MVGANPYLHLTNQELIMINPHQLSARNLEMYLEAVEAAFGSVAFILMVRGDLPEDLEEIITQTDQGERFYAFLSNLWENMAGGPEYVEDSSDEENQPPPPMPPPGA